MMVLTGSYLAAIIGMATVGVPALLLLSACVRISIMSLALVGVLSGLIYFNVIMSCFAYVLESSVGATAISSWWGGFFGVLVALTFGLLAGRPTVDGEGA